MESSHLKHAINWFTSIHVGWPVTWKLTYKSMGYASVKKSSLHVNSSHFSDRALISLQFYPHITNYSKKKKKKE